jgi:hypothetical protein
MLHIPKIHRIESEIHLNFPEIRPIQLGPNFFPKRIPEVQLVKAVFFVSHINEELLIAGEYSFY